MVVDIHVNIARGVPELVRKTGACLDALLGVANIVTRGVAGNEEEAQRVSAVLLDDLERVNAVAEGFAHLSALLVADDTVDKYGVERSLACLLDRRENHSRDPEEDDIVARDQSAGRVEIFEVFGILRPAEGRERPES